MSLHENLQNHSLTLNERQNMQGAYVNGYKRYVFTESTDRQEVEGETATARLLMQRIARPLLIWVNGLPTSLLDVCFYFWSMIW